MLEGGIERIFEGISEGFVLGYKEGAREEIFVGLCDIAIDGVNDKVSVGIELPGSKEGVAEGLDETRSNVGLSDSIVGNDEESPVGIPLGWLDQAFVVGLIEGAEETSMEGVSDMCLVGLDETDSVVGSEL